MAFRDTSERYEYIYGSNVKKLDRETAGSTKSGSTKRAGNTARKSEYAVEDSKCLFRNGNSEEYSPISGI